MPATRAIRHESQAGQWQLLLGEPDARLRGDVLVLEDYDERVAEPVVASYLFQGGQSEAQPT